MKVDWNTDQDMNWKIGWDICLNVGYWDTGLGTNFDIGLGFGQNTTIDLDFCLSWSTHSDMDSSLVKQGHSYLHAYNNSTKCQRKLTTTTPHSHHHSHDHHHNHHERSCSHLHDHC